MIEAASNYRKVVTRWIIERAMEIHPSQKVFWLLAISTICFPIALLEPIFTLSMGTGDVLLDALIEQFYPGFTSSKPISVLGGIAHLYGDRNGITDFLIATVLLFFCVFFPAIKLFLSWRVYWSFLRDRQEKLKSLIERLESVGPWSMMDVFVVSLLVICFKSFPGSTNLSAGLGYYLFLTTVVSNMMALRLLMVPMKSH